MESKISGRSGLAEEFSFLREITWKNFEAFLKARKRMVWTLIVAELFMYGVRLAQCLYGVDSELHIGSGRLYAWYVRIGRFGYSLLQNIWTRGSFFNPFSATFIALCFMLVGTLLFCYLLYEFSRRSLNDISVWIFAFTFISGGVWCEQLYFTLQAAECLLIMAAVPLNVILLFRGFAQKSRAAAAASVVTAVLSVSVYQGVFPLYAGTVFGCYILERDSWNGECDEKEHFTMCMKMLATLAASVAIYFVLNKIVQSLLHIEASNYLTKQIGGQNHNEALSPLVYFAMYIYKLTVGNIPPVNNLFAPIFASRARSGAAVLQRITADSAYANFLYIPAVIAFVVMAVRNSRRRPLYVLSAAGILVCVLAFPIAGAGGAAMRAQYIIPFAAAFLFIYVLKNTSGIAFKICAVILFVNCFYSVQLIGNLNYSDKLRFDEDVRLAADLDSRLKIFVAENKIKADSPVYFFGFHEPVESKNFIRAETSGYGPFYWSPAVRNGVQTAGTPSASVRRVAFMDTLLMDWTIGRDEDFMMRDCPSVVAEMPSYPEKGCVRYFDGAILVKLSDHPYAYEE